MVAPNKLILRKKEYRNLNQSREILEADGNLIIEVDVSFNALE